MAAQASNITTIDENSDVEDTKSSVQPSRPKRASIAKDTLDKLKNGWYKSSDGSKINLTDDVTFTNNNSILYTEDDLQNIKQLIRILDESTSSASSFSVDSDTLQTKIEVQHCTTLEAARELVGEVDEDQIGVLNFASAKNPGGGFLGGAQAQEESIARSSALYLAITQPQFMSGYYGYNRHGERGYYSHRMIYSPRVTIFKDDDGELLSLPYHVGILTVPAPNAGVIKDRIESRITMEQRVKRLLYVFKAHKHDVLILGAFGCGVFRNNPFDVAMIFREQLESSEYRNSFKRIIFAITNFEMCRIFKQVFNATDLLSIQKQIAAMSFDDSNTRHASSNKQNKQKKKKVNQQRKQKMQKNYANVDFDENSKLFYES
ncbi:hypothetical protein I4U23_015363 [Adineta vaga]|nr:hypothetical protein I4U23_015363 [Adineta vaga]